MLAYEPSTSHILSLVLEKPGNQTFIHITIHLSTSGHEAEFLQDTIDMVSEKYPDSIVLLRGDTNASIHPRKDNKRNLLFKYYADENKLYTVKLDQKTYHHFMNNGKSGCHHVLQGN